MENSLYFKREIDFTNNSHMLDCITFFDKNKSLSLNAKDFDALARSLLTDEEGKPNELPVAASADFFTAFDYNQDRKVDVEEFPTVWNKWIKPLVKPVSALLIIDVQNDFIDGTLAMKNCQSKQEGYDIIPVINNILDNIKFDVIVYSLDYHPDDHISFYDNVKYYKLSEKNVKKEPQIFDTVLFEGPPEMEQKLWPRHCVQQSWGSELHKDLKVAENSVFVYKGTNSKVDSYSAFWDNMKLSQTTLNEELARINVTHVFICGIAMDYCVGSTALDALELGYATVLIQDAIVETDQRNGEVMKEKLKSHLCVMADSNEIECLKSGKNVKTEFASVFIKLLQKD